MSKNYALKAEKRDRVGKGVARALRREGKVPAVIYGDSKEPVTIVLPEKELSLEYRKGRMFTTLCDLDIDGEKHMLLARDIQLHPVTDNVLHVDFLRVTSRTSLTVKVPVQFINENDSPGLQEKGILSVVRYDVELVCRATKIPDSVIIDLTPFNIGDAIKMSDAELPEGAESAFERDITIANISAPRTMVEEVAEDEEGEEGAEEGAEGGEEASEGEAASEGEEEKASE
jgi:large subunit ribosomal protein L25